MRCRAFLPTLVLLALFAGLALFAEPGQASKKYALLIGVNEYDKPGFSPLRYAERDVIELAKVLTEAGYEVKLLLGSKTGADQATRENIQAALENWVPRAKARDLLVVALSGHGQKLAGKDYFCPVDAVKNETGKMVSVEALVEQVEKHAGQRVLLVDACRDNSDPTRSFNADTVKLGENTALLRSCSTDQRAHESDKVRHGAFFYLVLEGLRGNLPAAKNDRGEVTWGKLSNTVAEVFDDRFKELVPNPTTTQEPKFASNLSPRTVLIPARANNKEIVLDLSSKVQLKLVRIPAAGKSFWMGSPKEEKDRSDDEDQHQVEFTRDYWLAVTETTQAQYQAIMDKNPSSFSSTGDRKERVKEMDTSNFPVESVPWDDAKEFCDKLTEKFRGRGLLFRLPTEAEWEYSCRGGSSSKDSLPFHFKNGPIASLSSRQANFDGNFPYGDAAKDEYLNRTCRVNSYEPNRFGLYDMHGNVWEWCQDYYGPYNKLKTQKDPLQDEKPDADRRVLRGGSWSFTGRICRAAIRNRYAPTNRNDVIGFRVACVASPRIP